MFACLASARMVRGSMRQRGKDAWELRVYRGVDPDTGRQRWATKTVRGSRRHASRELRAFAEEVGYARLRAGSVADLLEWWFAAASPHWAAPTVRQTRSVINCHLEDMVRDARYSGDTYALARTDGEREILYGVSVFAIRGDTTAADVLERFSASPNYLAVAVGKLRSAGFEVVATGANPDHFDVQLVRGVPADAPARTVDDAELASRAAALLRLAGSLAPNPAYAGGESSPEES